VHKLSRYQFLAAGAPMGMETIYWSEAAFSNYECVFPFPVLLRFEERIPLKFRTKYQLNV
jgi:hypothetical protein